MIGSYRNLLFLVGFPLVFLAIIFFSPVPDPLFDDPYATVIESREGKLLSARIASDGQWRFPLPAVLPEKYVRCVTTFEDRYFFVHPGINPFSLARAVWQNLSEGRIVSGGSTITMQLARIARGNRERTLPQKILEMWLALRIERKYSKEEILRMYAGHAPFGGNVVGINSAAWRYFNRPVDELSWAETATLAILPNAPGLIFPGNGDESLIEKRNRLLIKLQERDHIDRATCRLALAEPIPRRPLPLPDLAGHLLNRAVNTLGEGNRIRTTLDPILQRTVNKMTEEYHDQFSYREIHNAAAIVVEIATREVMAYVGNVGDPEEGDHSQKVDIIDSRRSPGSLLKPVLYALAIDEGLLIPTQLLPDIPIYYQGFVPQNFDRQFRGAVHADKALRSSLNVPFVNLLKDYGYEKFHDKLRKLGISSLDHHAGHYGLTLILGGGEVTLWEISALYAGMARSLIRYAETTGSNHYAGDDYRPNTWMMEKTGNRSSHHLEKGMISAAAIWHTFSAMQELYRPEEFSNWEQFTSCERIAWKTGTSYGHKDAWALGLNDTYVVGVWMGNADGEGRPDLTGVTAAAPLMFRIFQVLDGGASFPQPAGELIVMKICKASGFKAGQLCKETEEKFVSRAALKTPACPYHVEVHIDETGTYQVNSECYPVHRMKHESWFTLPPAQAYYYKKHNSDYADPPAFAEECLPENPGMIEMIYPRMFTKVFIPVEIDGRDGRVVFHATHQNPERSIYWHLDDNYLGATTDNHQIGIRPGRGRHVLNLVDDMGTELSIPFEVLNE